VSTERFFKNKNTILKDYPLIYTPTLSKSLTLCTHTHQIPTIREQLKLAKIDFPRRKKFIHRQYSSHNSNNKLATNKIVDTIMLLYKN